MFDGMLGGHNNQQLYLQGYHVVVVDGIPLSGFDAGDFIKIRIAGGGAVILSGGDGPAMQYTVQNGGELEISVLPTGRAFLDLATLRATQFQSTDRRLFSVVIMSGVEEVFSFAGCAFGDLPEFSTGGPVMQPRTFLIKFLKPNFQPSPKVSG